jgi:hypothetical protein
MYDDHIGVSILCKMWKMDDEVKHVLKSIEIVL